MTFEELKNSKQFDLVVNVLEREEQKDERLRWFVYACIEHEEENFVEWRAAMALSWRSVKSVLDYLDNAHDDNEVTKAMIKHLQSKLKERKNNAQSDD